MSRFEVVSSILTMCLGAVDSLPLAAQAPGPRLGFILPDQTRVELHAEPPLRAKKMTQLKLIWPSESAWKPIGFDALMPTHKHGMIVKPMLPQKLANPSPIIYQIEGVKLHMQGPWLLRLQLENKDGIKKWVQTPIEIP